MDIVAFAVLYCAVAAVGARVCWKAWRDGGFDPTKAYRAGMPRSRVGEARIRQPVRDPLSRSTARDILPNADAGLDRPLIGVALIQRFLR